MTASIKILSLANSLATHAYKRQGLVAANIANADTPGYKAKDLADFSTRTADQFVLRKSRPGHHTPTSEHSSEGVVMAVTTGAQSPNGNNVSVEDQMVRSADLKQQHDLALGVYKKSMTILRAGLGRR